MSMAMNLRLPEDLANELRSRAESTGRSQQELARTAIEAYLHSDANRDLTPWLRANIKPPIGPYVPMPVAHRTTRPPGMALSDLLRLGRDAR